LRPLFGREVKGFTGRKFPEGDVQQAKRRMNSTAVSGWGGKRCFGRGGGGRSGGDAPEGCSVADRSQCECLIERKEKHQKESTRE